MKRAILYLFFCLIWILPEGTAQIDAGFVRDSIEIERGVTGTPDFEPLFRLVNTAFDDDNRPLTSIVYRYETETELVPVQRQTFEYNEEGKTTLFLLEEWDEGEGDWAALKQEESSYEDGRLVTFLRKRPVDGVLENRRRWSYQYTMGGMESGKLLQSWNSGMGSWENLSRKTTSYDVDGHISEQVLERFNGGSWKNSRKRTWSWDPGAMQPAQTIAQIWSSSEQEWVNNTRKSYSIGGDGLWSNAIIEQWNPSTGMWENDLREQLTINLANATNNYSLNTWNGEWQANLRGEFSFSTDETQALLQSWNTTEMQYDNFLRSRSMFNNMRLPVRQTGMQIWNTDAGSWENRQFTRRTTYFWRSTDPNNTTEVVQNKCTIPNPYLSGLTINCELTNERFPLNLEVYNLYGQVVLRQQVDSPTFAVTTHDLPSGLYVFKLSDDQVIYQLQKIAVAN